ncbi:MAG: Bax inhibitor-1/YccA family protein [Candidatus Babeliaceae bacterium]|nr:Bax inhibitor-1/YccA family protein [Candidatus Babeliaceae bacterium]
MENRHYAQTYEGAQSFVYRVFGWMAYALALTGFTAYYIAITPSLSNLFLKNGLVLMLLFLGQIGLVVALSAAITRLSYSAAFTMFSIYSVLTGITLSTIFLFFTTASIASVFFITAGMFASFALYGAFTKANLTSMGSILRMALWGIIISLLVNIFLRSQTFDLIISIIGVVVFAGLTAYDIQKITALARQTDVAESEFGKVLSINAALQLYLDFVNLFLNLLTLFGQRKDR